MKNIIHNKIISKFESYAYSTPEKLAFVSLHPESKTTITFRQLDLRAKKIASYLQNQALEKKPVLLLFPAGIDFICAFLGCLYAGIISVPVNCVTDKRISKNVLYIEQIYQDAQAACIMSEQNTIHAYQAYLATISWIDITTIDEKERINYQTPKILDTTISHLQYSSGSTAVPKGIIVQHQQLRHTLHYTSLVWNYTHNSKTVTWAPHSHVYGLICGLLLPLYNGSTTYIMSPASFLQNPRLWLENITHYQISHTGGPNFSYELCCNELNGEKIKGLDLTSLSIMVNGGEPVREKTILLFTTLMKSIGFSAEMLCPAYGMSELTGLIASKLPTHQNRIITIDEKALLNNNVIVSQANKHSRKIVSNGRVITGLKCVIINPVTLELLAENTVGEICLSGKSVTSGYWNKPDENNATFLKLKYNSRSYTFLRTGDLGFIQQGELFLCGRYKDVIIIHGMNYHPQDIEILAEHSHRALKHCNCAAFSIDTDNLERVVLAVEMNRMNKILNFTEIAQSIRRSITKQFEIDIHEIIFITHGSLPRTFGGKIQRVACRQLYLSRKFPGILYRNSKSEKINELVTITDPSTTLLSKIENDLKAIVANHLHIPAQQINYEQDLSAYGIDSITQVSLVNKINHLYNITLNPDDFIVHDTVLSIAQYILNRYPIQSNNYYDQCT